MAWSPAYTCGISHGVPEEEPVENDGRAVVCDGADNDIGPVRHRLPSPGGGPDKTSFCAVEPDLSCVPSYSSRSQTATLLSVSATSTR